MLVLLWSVWKRWWYLGTCFQCVRSVLRDALGASTLLSQLAIACDNGELKPDVKDLWALMSAAYPDTHLIKLQLWTVRVSPVSDIKKNKQAGFNLKFQPQQPQHAVAHVYV